MKDWKRSDLVDYVDKLRAARDAVERSGNRAPDYVVLAIDEAERELDRRDAEGNV